MARTPSLLDSRWRVSGWNPTLNDHRNISSLVPPEWISKPQDALTVKEGSSVNIECTARGEPQPTVTIAKDGRTRDLLPCIQFTQSFPGHSGPLAAFRGSALKIESVKSSNAGFYSCHASNGIGQDLVTRFSLVVKGTWIFPLWF